MKKMFDEIKNMCKRVAKLNQGKIMNTILKGELMQAQILDLQTQTQMFEQGVDSKGESLGEYSANTIYGTSKYAGKIAKNQPYDHITLKDTGAFYKSIYIKSLPTGITINAPDPNNLQALYANDLLGLTEQSLSTLRPEFKERLIDATKAAIRG